jgi:His-Xaa-Ser system protein HxsD
VDIRFKDSEIEVLLDRDIYNIEMLYKCFYWYAGSYSIDITEVDTEHFLVSLKLQKDTINSINNEEMGDKIRTDLIDFKLREIVTKETSNIRDLIIAKAFAHYEEPLIPGSVVSDPVGFDPSELKKK